MAPIPLIPQEPRVLILLVSISPDLLSLSVGFLGLLVFLNILDLVF